MPTARNDTCDLQHVDSFVYSMALEETDMEKHDKILSLKLKPSEWEHAGLFLGLLAVCILCSISLKLMFSHFRTARR